MKPRINRSVNKSGMKIMFLPKIRFNTLTPEQKKKLTEIKNNLNKVNSSTNVNVFKNNYVNDKINNNHNHIHKKEIQRNKNIPPLPFIKKKVSNLYKSVFNTNKFITPQCNKDNIITDDNYSTGDCMLKYCHPKEYYLTSYNNINDENENLQIKFKPKKIDLQTKAKKMRPKINDVDEFKAELSKKHKHLLKKSSSSLSAYNNNTEDNDYIPKMLYEDREYFKERFGKKRPVKNISITNSYLLRPELLDYNSYVNKVEDAFTHYNQDHLANDVLDCKNNFYEDILNKIVSDPQPQIISYSNSSTHQAGNSLFDKFQNFLKSQNPSNITEAKTNNNFLESFVPFSNNILTINTRNLVKYGSTNLTTNLNKGSSQVRNNLRSKHGSKNTIKRLFQNSESFANYNSKIINSLSIQPKTFVNNNEDNKEKDISKEEDDEESESETSLMDKKRINLLFVPKTQNKRGSGIEIKNGDIEFDLSNSFLDNSYIFEKDSLDQEQNKKFGLQIKKEIQLNKKKEKSLYDKYLLNKLRMDKYFSKNGG